MGNNSICGCKDKEKEKEEENEDNLVNILTVLMCNLRLGA